MFARRAPVRGCRTWPRLNVAEVEALLLKAISIGGSPKVTGFRMLKAVQILPDGVPFTDPCGRFSRASGSSPTCSLLSHGKPEMPANWKDLLSSNGAWAGAPYFPRAHCWEDRRFDSGGTTGGQQDRIGGVRLNRKRTAVPSPSYGEATRQNHSLHRANENWPAGRGTSYFPVQNDRL